MDVVGPLANAPKWLLLARAEIGQKEIPGPGANPRILEYFRATSIRTATDETPSCAAFVCWCVEGAGFRSTRSARARDWVGWGAPADKNEIGAVCVIYKPNANPSMTRSGYHVGFLLQEDKDGVLLLGSNQSDRVKSSLYRFDRGWKVVARRWPVSAS